MRRSRKMVFVLVCIMFIGTILTGCGLPLSKELIVNRYADALLTKNNELQFRFRINNEILDRHELYKVKVTIHDDQLVAAIGKREIIYGEEQVLNGEYLEVKGKSEKYIFMDPLPLKEDLHIHEIENMIEKNQAVSIEIYNNQEVFGRVYLTNFSSEL
ncbi:hypothetical protein MLOOGBEN_11840 [Bacillus sp. EB106-08-02-XG196]|jgi:hypothetical protein|uniref:hypothetical protein n=1 Tax=Bacillus sp. EB106-08-02-XG196 TaxID=2737049 RepID=UPI0015C49B9B|nr:hypothetical protein [Bacillus sp. EB106-08-02-XG196]NWQ41385.1 hypothetical protein [Bacillus sp. EB106-08-02-XG196]